MFKLIDEQIESIIMDYDVSLVFINKIEKLLNLIGVVDNDEDYFEIVALCASRKATNKFNVSNCTRKEEAIKMFMTIEEIVMTELNRKYNNFEDASPVTLAKVENYKRRK